MIRGQSLVEVIVALAVVVALAISLVTTSLLTQRTSRSASSNTLATKLVQENIEQVRIFRDRVGFASLANNACWVLVATDADPSKWYLSNATSYSPTPNPLPPSHTACPETKTLGQTNFTREINILDGTDPAKQKKIIVKVKWTDAAGAQMVTNDTVLSNCVSSTTSC